MPRGKQAEKIPSHYNSEDYYKFYKKKYGNNISQSTFTKVLKLFYTRLINEYVLKGETVILPANMGKLVVKKKKSEVSIGKDGKLVNKLPIDFAATNKLWAQNKEAKEKKILVRHLNKHTNGYVYKFIYDKTRARFKNKNVYRFTATRTHKRNLAKVVRDKKNIVEFLKQR